VDAKLVGEKSRDGERVRRRKGRRKRGRKGKVGQDMLR